MNGIPRINGTVTIEEGATYSRMGMHAFPRYRVVDASPTIEIFPPE
jgi:hypothetical protein